MKAASLIAFFLLLFPLVSVAGNHREDSVAKHPLVHSFSLSAGLDYVPSSVTDDIREPVPASEKIKVNSSVPVHFKYAFSFTDPKVKNYLPGGYQGIGVGLLNFGAAQPRGFSKAYRNIGYPVMLYLFQGGPFWHHGNLSLGYEWNFGAAIGWKPYSEANKNFNLTVGSQVNAYLNLNLQLLWQLNPNFGLFAGLAVSHYSNGNTSFPNPGVNSIGLRLGMVYTLNPPAEGFPAAVPDTVGKRRMVYDISAWGASRKRVYRGGEEPVLLPGHFACAGISFAPLVRLNTWWLVGGSLDLQWDESSDMKRNYVEGSTTDDIKFNRPDFFRQVSVGISAHGELQMPIFAVNVGVGYNFVAPWENRGTYQNITLKTRIAGPVYLNVGYQLRNFYQQGSLLLGLGCRL